MPGKQILIIDDDISVSTVVKIALEKMYHVAVANSATRGLKYLSENKVDLVLLDIKMPGTDGIEVLREIKKKYSGTTVAMLTAYASADNVRKANYLGAYGFIAKPFDIYALRNYVDSVLS